MASSAIKRRGEKWLSAVEIMCVGDGDHQDGGGLVFRVRGVSRAWVYRFTSPETGKRREMGLGVDGDSSTTKAAGAWSVKARLARDAARALVDRDIDPIDHRERERETRRTEAAARKRSSTSEQLTLARVARAYHARSIEPVRSSKHAREWLAALENHVPPHLWHRPIAETNRYS